VVCIYITTQIYRIKFTKNFVNCLKDACLLLVNMRNHSFVTAEITIVRASVNNGTILYKDERMLVFLKRKSRTYIMVIRPQTSFLGHDLESLSS